MSMDPGMARRGDAPPSVAALDAPPAGLPEITRVEVLQLREGDRLIVHVDGAAGMSAGGATRIGEIVQARLLDGLPFDVPVLVVAPGIRVQVARPS